MPLLCLCPLAACAGALAPDTGDSWLALPENGLPDPDRKKARDLPVRAASEPDSSPPVVLEAAEMDYDKENERITATGNVEVTQGDTILLADFLSYDQRTGVVKANGHVSMLEPTGHVYFAEEVELTDDMRTGIVRQFRARLSDNSVFAAREAHKIDENRTELTQAVYSPCSIVCEDGSPRTPTWQIKADKVLRDDAAQRVTYRNAFMELYGVPVFYTPYMSHATPDADNKSGLLTPQYAFSENLGTTINAPVYFAFAPDKDMTLTPVYMTKEGLLMDAEYRQQFDSGLFYFSGSATVPDKRDASGGRTTGQDFRGHVDSKGHFILSDQYDWGFHVRRATDDTYLRRYKLYGDTFLPSRLYGEAFNFIGDTRRTYAIAQGLAFQGLTSADDADRLPLVLPLVDFFYQGDPMRWGSRFDVQANGLVLTRSVGAESRRISLAGGWNLPYITEGGQVIEFRTQLRGDLYNITDQPLSATQSFSGNAGRLVPTVSALWHYPFVRRFDHSSLILEPTALLAASTSGGNPEEIPNEDSRFPEFTDANLFSINRYQGYDRVESGPRAAYGLRGHMQFDTGENINALFGQSYVSDVDRRFPYSNDPDAHFSDYVGKVGFAYKPVDVNYRFRLDRDTFSPKRNEVDAGLTLRRLQLSAAYLALEDDPVLATREEITAGAAVKVTDYWTTSFYARRDLELDALVNTGVGLTFQNECLTVMTGVSWLYTRDRDVKPDTSFMFRAFLKNFD